jgi:hypothetical protein
VRFDRLDRFLTVRGFYHRVTVRFQHKSHQAAGIGIIFDNKNRFRHSSTEEIFQNKRTLIITIKSFSPRATGAIVNREIARLKFPGDKKPEIPNPDSSLRRRIILLKLLLLFADYNKKFRLTKTLKAQG